MGCSAVEYKNNSTPYICPHVASRALIGPEPTVLGLVTNVITQI